MPDLKPSSCVCQAALFQEKSERARIVLSLRDTITGLKQAGDVEGRLKADLVQTHEDLATSRAAQVSSFRFVRIPGDMLGSLHMMLSQG